MRDSLLKRVFCKNLRIWIEGFFKQFRNLLSNANLLSSFFLRQFKVQKIGQVWKRSYQWCGYKAVELMPS